jgi:hypothetical protein
MVAAVDALDALAPTGPGYARLPVADAFTWSECTDALGTGEWYLVAFRSIVKPGADLERLCAFDDNAHHEAAGAPGFVHYFKGPLDTDGSCMSFCLWTSRAEARAAAGLSHHRAAVTIIGETYSLYNLEFLRVRRTAMAAALEFEPYDADRHAAPDAWLQNAQLGFSPA